MEQSLLEKVTVCSSKKRINQGGGYEKLTFFKKDARNNLNEIKRLQLKGGDDIAMQNCFLKIKSDNSSFFSMIDLNEKVRLKNVFWADAKSRAAWRDFGNVVHAICSFCLSEPPWAIDIARIWINLKGILCKHRITVFIHRKIYQVPEKYILRKWNKNVKRSHMRVRIRYDNCSSKPKDFEETENVHVTSFGVIGTQEGFTLNISISIKNRRTVCNAPNF
ncbi:hypothetical protein HYC85_029350 [Camellia sinensis]|uniref:Protein FAR1-RELATED SEQUENCE n=1 Tax=Camellia sinensis TaxID=4442 RepID=A0A7J7FY00_CAMSI|nr:hypothetical protein HYC85_029350 [Camellia sinensis]